MRRRPCWATGSGRGPGRRRRRARLRRGNRKTPRQTPDIRRGRRHAKIPLEKIPRERWSGQGSQRAKSSGAARADRPRREYSGAGPGLFPADGAGNSRDEAAARRRAGGKAGHAGGEPGGGNVLRRRPHRFRRRIGDVGDEGNGQRAGDARSWRRGRRADRARHRRRRGRGTFLRDGEIRQGLGIDGLPGRRVKKRIRQARDQIPDR